VLPSQAVICDPASRKPSTLIRGAGSGQSLLKRAVTPTPDRFFFIQGARCFGNDSNPSARPLLLGHIQQAQPLLCITKRDGARVLSRLTYPFFADQVLLVLPRLSPVFHDSATRNKSGRLTQHGLHAFVTSPGTGQENDSKPTPNTRTLIEASIPRPPPRIAQCPLPIACHTLSPLPQSLPCSSATARLQRIGDCMCL
jgi:hypothetical protein